MRPDVRSTALAQYYSVRLYYDNIVVVVVEKKNDF